MLHLAFEQEYHYIQSECQGTVGINKQSYYHGLDFPSAVQRGFTETRISVDIIISCMLALVSFFFKPREQETQSFIKQYIVSSNA